MGGEGGAFLKRKKEALFWEREKGVSKGRGEWLIIFHPDDY